MKYCEVNEGIKPNEVNKAVTALKGIANRQIGVIELDAALILMKLQKSLSV